MSSRQASHAELVCEVRHWTDARSKEPAAEKGQGRWGARALGMSLVDHPAFLAFFFLPQNVYVHTHEL